MPTPSAPARAGRWLAWVMFAGSASTALVLLAFFVVGLGDGSVSSFNMGLWLVLLGVAALSLCGGGWLQARGRPVLAMLAFAVTAVPGLLAAMFMLLLVIAQPSWR